MSVLLAEMRTSPRAAGPQKPARRGISHNPAKPAVVVTTTVFARCSPRCPLAWVQPLQHVDHRALQQLAASLRRSARYRRWNNGVPWGLQRGLAGHRRLRRRQLVGGLGEARVARAALEGFELVSGGDKYWRLPHRLGIQICMQTIPKYRLDMGLTRNTGATRNQNPGAPGRNANSACKESRMNTDRKLSSNVLATPCWRVVGNKEHAGAQCLQGTLAG